MRRIGFASIVSEASIGSQQVLPNLGDVPVKPGHIFLGLGSIAQETASMVCSDCEIPMPLRRDEEPSPTVFSSAKKPGFIKSDGSVAAVRISLAVQTTY